MDNFMQNVSTISLSQTIENNVIQFLLALGHAAGGKEDNQFQMQWIVSGSPTAYYNCVTRANLTPEIVDSAIIASLKQFQAHQVPGMWNVGPSMYPTSICKHLLDHGFTYSGYETGMAVNLLALNKDLTPLEDLRIERVQNQQDLEAWCNIVAISFEDDEAQATWLKNVYSKWGFSDHLPWRHYLGRLNGKPVATASLFLDTNVAGIYFVSTLPEARRQGIGAAIVLKVLHDARKSGCSFGVLAATQSGISIYRRLGFQAYCIFHYYEMQLLN